ncbi:MAG: response regulator transcription factor [Candidatus Dormibacteraeota bacterium]|nr:response regulator transcription factor [Candidatus Dormibacteraeota bacterium]
MGSPGSAPLRVVIVDDQALVRAGFRLILDTEDGIEVVGEGSDGEEAIATVRRTRPDVVLMDVRMPRMDGLEATRRLLGDGAQCRVIMLTTFDLDEYVYAALQAGASGFLLKEVSPEQLIAAVRMVAAGDALLAPSITRRLIERFARRDPPSPAPGALGSLTEREREVLVLIARGHTNQEVADDLHLSEATVKTHVARIFAKLDLRDRAQAVVVAYESGLVHAGS